MPRTAYEFAVTVYGTDLALESENNPFERRRADLHRAAETDAVLGADGEDAGSRESRGRNGAGAYTGAKRVRKPVRGGVYGPGTRGRRGEVRRERPRHGGDAEVSPSAHSWCPIRLDFRSAIRTPDARVPGSGV